MNPFTEIIFAKELFSVCSEVKKSGPKGPILSMSRMLLDFCPTVLRIPVKLIY